ncbi:MAG: monofunctional biosynthetic peptidoglycan transglycosylase [Proteobacteria bacterium]|nr:monofunctional biosynthetic peptidoglycan transglycosylase [Pseudomonadota bacterium]
MATNRPAAPARSRRGSHTSPSRQRGRLAGRLLRWFALALTAWLVLTVSAVLLLRWVNPFTSAMMVEARLTAWAAQQQDYHTDFRWVSLEQISGHAAIAVVASEDQLFPYHAGFDFNSIRAAVRASEQGKRLRGASTISQQVAKNLFLWSGHSFVRKGLEAYFTVLIELCWPKERILEMYLNVAQFGDGIYGVQAAAARFWHKNASQLSSGEAATLAAVLPNPMKMHPDRPSRYVLMRRDQILVQMRALGGESYLRAVEQERPAR